VKKSFLLAAIAALILISLAAFSVGASAAGDWPHYRSFQDLASAATDVVRVEVLDEREDWFNPFLNPLPPEIDPYRLYTVYRLRVLDVFQGDAQVGDVIEVRLRVGAVVYGDLSIAIGDDLVLFLYASVIEGNPAFLVNPTQGAYRSRHLSGTFTILQNIHPRSRFVPLVTMGNLRQLAAENFGPSASGSATNETRMVWLTGTLLIAIVLRNRLWRMQFDSAVQQDTSRLDS